MNKLFTNKHWIGEFFYPDAFESRFFGQIDYSPEDGVTLSYTIGCDDVPDNSEIIYGILSTGKKCTLIGHFSYKDGGFIATKDGLLVYQGQVNFPLLAIGEFLSSDEKFHEVYFTHTNIQEFFFPKGHKDFIKYSEQPIYKISTPFGKIEVENTATFKPLYSEDINSKIYSQEPEAVNELIQELKKIEEKYPKANIMFKEDIIYRIFLNFDSAVTARDAYNQVADFSNLFALLIYKPLYPESIQIRKTGTDRNPIWIDLYPSIFINHRTVKLSTSELFHKLMPITISNITLEVIISEWLKARQNNSIILSSIQNETGFRDQHTVHGEFVLYATQFESISYNAKQKANKYEYPLTNYACQKIKDSIAKILDKPLISDAAIAIGDLRNEITHVGKPKKVLSNLSLHDLIRISKYLQLTLIGYMLHTIGVPQDVITKYQDKFSPDA